MNRDSKDATSLIVRPLMMGTLAFGALITIYFGVLALLSGWDFTVSQFSDYWYYLVPLAAGFGAQIGLYTYLKQLALRHEHCRNVVAATGTTSTAAMMAILPVVGVAGAVTLIAQYQVGLFWVGLAFNAAGIAYVGHKVYIGRKHFLGSTP